MHFFQCGVYLSELFRFKKFKLTYYGLPAQKCIQAKNIYLDDYS